MRDSWTSERSNSQRVTTEGVSRQIVAQVCDVSKSLISVKKIMSACEKVVFDPNGSDTEDKTTREKMWMWILRMWVKRVLLAGVGSFES